MKYLWEVVLEARREGIPARELRFVHDSHASPYMELSLPCLNQTWMEESGEVQVNAYYRFYHIFAHMFPPGQEEYRALREGLTSLLFHMLADNDVRKGLGREEYHKRLLAGDIRAGVFGEIWAAVYARLAGEEQEKLLGCWLRSCRTGSCLAIFTDMVRELIHDSIIYHNTDCPDEILIYTGQRLTRELEWKIGFLTDLFLDIRYHTEIYYEYHFGIIGMEETMRIDEIALY